MESNIFKYGNDEIEVSWDQKRCIHAAECVHRSPDVFDVNRKPWIDPDSSDVESLRETIHACPSGALKYTIKTTGESEKTPSGNLIEIVENGPLYISGDIQIVDKEGNEVLKDTRVALCRCGASANKPLCDLSHDKASFQAGTAFNPERLDLEPSDSADGTLTVTLVPNGAFVVTGKYKVTSGEQGPDTVTQKKMSFCRCGASANKPFCDGSHRAIEFISE